MHKYKILLLSLLMIPLISFSQTEEKPKYAPGKEKHRNKTDEFGQKQGTWKTFNSYGDIMTEVEYLNDKRQEFRSVTIVTGKSWKSKNSRMVSKKVFTKDTIIQEL